MANFNPTIITDSGLSLIAKISSGSGQMSFTRICTSKSSYSVDEAQHLSALTTVEQETTIDKVEIINDTAVKVSAVITNKLLESGYYINAIGLYAEDPDLGEILYSITIAKVPDWMQPDSGSGVSSLLIQLITQVSNSSTVKTELNPSVLVTVQDLLDHTNNTTVHVTAGEKEKWNGKAELSDIPTTLPANGGNSSTTDYQIQHRLSDGTDVLTFATSDNCPYNVNTKVRIMNCPTCPTNYGYDGSDNDFWYDIYKLDSNYITIKSYDIRTNFEYTKSCLNGNWSDWTRCSDYGNADTLDGFHASNFFINNKPHITSGTSTESSIHLKWLPVDNATKYAVSIYNGTSYTVLSNNITDTEYTITGLTSGTEYQLLVQAYVNNDWNTVKVENHIIIRTTPVASTSSSGIVTTGTQRFGGTKVVTGNLYAQIPSYAVSDGIPSTNQMRYVKIVDKNDVTIADFNGQVSPAGISYGQIRAQAIGDSSKVASISTCVNSDGGNIRHVCSSPSNPSTTSLRQLASGTAAANTTNCPSGAWYGKHS